MNRKKSLKLNQKFDSKLKYFNRRLKNTDNFRSGRTTGKYTLFEPK